jgi:hypothetical protein
VPAPSENPVRAVTDSSNGLMAFWSSIEPAHQLAFQRWHNCEHIPERVSIAGFLRGRRYRSVADSERFLMFYETLDDHVLSSPAYLAALNAPTARTREALGWFRKSTRSVFRLEHSAGRGDDWPAPVLVVARLAGAGADPRGALTALHDSGLFSRVRLFRASGDSVSARSNEAAIHGASTGPLDMLLLGESTRLDLLDDTKARERLPDVLGSALAADQLAGGDVEVFSLDFALDRR